MSNLETALAATGFDFAHHAWSHAPDSDYGVFTEYGENVLHGSNHHSEAVMITAVHYFTRDDSTTPRTTIETALETLDAPWYLESIQYESDIGYIHYEWIVEVL